MKIKYTEHAKHKLKILSHLGVTEEKVRKTLEEPDEILYDVLRDRLVAVNYSLKIAVLFERERENIVIVTVLYSSDLKNIVERRKRSGRWM